MNPEVLGCFSQFSNFSDFSWFWDALAINFDLLAWFPARGWSEISLGMNFKLIQVRTCPNSFFGGRMFRSRCLGNSQTRRYARSPLNTKIIWFLKFTAQSVGMNFFSGNFIMNEFFHQNSHPNSDFASQRARPLLRARTSHLDQIEAFIS